MGDVAQVRTRAGGVLAATCAAVIVTSGSLGDVFGRIHAPNESVDPGEIERMAVAEARFLQAYLEVT